jgi:hypothetical protein
MREFRELFIDERWGLSYVDERTERWCRVRREKFVVDEGMERMVENEKRLRMVEDE